MSYKVGNGIRIDCPAGSLDGLMEGLLRRIERVGLARRHAYLARGVAAVLDRRALAAAGLVPPAPAAADDPLDLAWSGLLAERGRTQARRERSPETDEEVVVRVHATGHGILGRVFEDMQGAALEEALATPGVAEFGYWTGCDDRPRGVGRREWERRRLAWDEVAAGTWGAAREYRARPDLATCDPGEVAARIPARDLRVARLAREIALGEWVGGRQVGAHNAVALMLAFQAEAGAGGRAQELVAAWSRRLAAALPRDSELAALVRALPAPGGTGPATVAP